MDIVCVSGRHPARQGLGADRADSSSAPPSFWVAQRVSTALAAAGHQVRWLICDGDPNEQRSAAGPDSQAVEMVRCAPSTASSPPSFRDVVGPLEDHASEVTLQRMLRERPADVVHLFGFGTPGTAQLPWIAERMGARVVVSTDTAASLCHRGSFVYGVDGSPCSTVDDPERCARCCLTADGRGDALGRMAAWWGRRARWLGDASPWPEASSFLSRLDLVVGSAMIADALLVEDEEAHALWLSAGVSKRKVAVSPVGPAAARADLGWIDALEELYGLGAVSSARSSK